MGSKLKEKCENDGRSENMIQVCESDGPWWSVILAGGREMKGEMVRVEFQPYSLGRWEILSRVW